MDAVVRMLVAGYPHQPGKEDGVSTNHCLFVVQALTNRLFPLVLLPGTVSFFISSAHQHTVVERGEFLSRDANTPVLCKVRSFGGSVDSRPIEMGRTHLKKKIPF